MCLFIIKERSFIFRNSSKGMITTVLSKNLETVNHQKRFTFTIVSTETVIPKHVVTTQEKRTQYL